MVVGIIREELWEDAHLCGVYCRCILHQLSTGNTQLKRANIDKKASVAILTATTNVKSPPNFTAGNLDAEPFCVFRKPRFESGVSVFTQL